MKNFLFTVLPILCLLLASAAFYAGQYTLASRVSEPVVRDEPAALEAEVDYSPYAQPVTGGDGVLYLPDGAAVGDFDAVKIRTRHFGFSIPGRWAGNVVVKSVQADAAVAGEGAWAVQFFEKQAYAKYRTQEHANDKDAQLKGKLTEVLAVPAGNVTAAIEENARQLKCGYVPGYVLYLLQLGESSGTADEEYGDAYDFLINADYTGCILASLEGEDFLYANGYLEKTAGAYAGDRYGPDQMEEFLAGRPEKAAPYGPSGEEPVAPVIPQTPSYPWQPFLSPWVYQDGGNMYAFGAQESGGDIPWNLLPGEIGG